MFCLRLDCWIVFISEAWIYVRYAAVLCLDAEVERERKIKWMQIGEIRSSVTGDS
jgi:hypothetical protein